MRYTVFSFTFFCLLPALLRAEVKLQWPVEEKYQIQISSTFGESRLDHFHNGLDIPGENIPVRPVYKGRLVWHTEGKERLGEIPFGGGGTVVLQHDLVQSGYMHLNQVNAELIEKKQVGLNSKLGTSGNTGHSGGAHLHFFVYDLKSKKFHNPLLLLPDKKQHYTDEKPPEAMAYAVRLPERIARVNLDRTIILSKDYPLYANFYDRGRGRERWGIYFLRAFNQENNRPVQEVKFDYIQFKKNRFRTSNGKTFEEVYHMNWYLLGKGFKQNKKLIWQAGGYHGPASKAAFDLSIQDK